VRFRSPRRKQGVSGSTVVARVAPAQSFTDKTDPWSSGEEEIRSSSRLLFSHGHAAVTSFVWTGFFMNLHGIEISESKAVQATALYQVGGRIGARDRLVNGPARTGFRSRWGTFFCSAAYLRNPSGRQFASNCQLRSIWRRVLCCRRTSRRKCIRQFALSDGHALYRS
jgi:hypothetical protein